MKGSVSQIGPYRIEEKIGTGGMGCIYRGVREGVGGFERPVAVKVLHPHLADNEEYVRMFHEEARLASRLAHPVLVPVRDLGVAEGTHYMVMDLLCGETLSDLYRRFTDRKKGFPRGHALYVVSRVLDGLHYAHELAAADGTPLGVVHRDVSPRNIFVTASGSVRLVDFGIARHEERQGQTQAGVVKGTVPYMAPEQALGQPLDRRADIFAAGVILHELLTGHAPLESERTDPQRRELASMKLRPRLKEIHLSMRPVVEKALAPRPESRWNTAEEMAEALREALGALEPSHEPQKLAGMASGAVRRKRAKKSRKKKVVETDTGGGRGTKERPSTHHRRERGPGEMRRQRVGPEAALQLDPRGPPGPWDAAHTMTLLATLIILCGLLYTFVSA